MMYKIKGTFADSKQKLIFIPSLKILIPFNKL